MTLRYRLKPVGKRHGKSDCYRYHGALLTRTTTGKWGRWDTTAKAWRTLMVQGLITDLDEKRKELLT